jgi:hypothetical protein
MVSVEEAQQQIGQAQAQLEAQKRAVEEARIKSQSQMALRNKSLAERKKIAEQLLRQQEDISGQEAQLTSQEQAIQQYQQQQQQAQAGYGAGLEAYNEARSWYNATQSGRSIPISSLSPEARRYALDMAGAEQALTTLKSTAAEGASLEQLQKMYPSVKFETTTIPAETVQVPREESLFFQPAFGKPTDIKQQFMTAVQYAPTTADIQRYQQAGYTPKESYELAKYSAINQISPSLKTKEDILISGGLSQPKITTKQLKESFFYTALPYVAQKISEPLEKSKKYREFEQKLSEKAYKFITSRKSPALSMITRSGINLATGLIYTAPISAFFSPAFASSAFDFSASKIGLSKTELASVEAGNVKYTKLRLKILREYEKQIEAGGMLGNIKAETELKTFQKEFPIVKPSSFISTEQSLLKLAGEKATLRAGDITTKISDITFGTKIAGKKEISVFADKILKTPEGQAYFKTKEETIKAIIDISKGKMEALNLYQN